MGTTSGCGPTMREMLARLATPVRNRYYYGKLLDAHHLELEQDYGNRKRWLLNRLTLGSGVLCGLEVTASTDGRQVRVAPGVAIDGWGREIIVPADSRGVDPRQATDDCGRLDGDPIRGPATVSLWICYYECPAEPAPVVASECPDERCEHGLIRERYRLQVREERAPSPGIVVEKQCQRIFADPGQSTRRQVLCETLDGNCESPEESCVPLAEIDLNADGVVTAIRTCGVRRTVYSNAVLLDLILCLAERVDQCCPPVTVRSLQLISGNNQSGTFNQPVPEPLVVMVSEGGAPVANENVTFEVAAGGGAVGGTPATVGPSFVVATAADGIAKLPVWRLGPNDPNQRVTAKIAAGSPSMVTFRAKPHPEDVKLPVVVAVWPPNATVLTRDTEDEQLRKWRNEWQESRQFEITFDRAMNAARLDDVRPWLQLVAIVRRTDAIAIVVPLEIKHVGSTTSPRIGSISGVTEVFQISELGDLAQVDTTFLIQMRAESGTIVDTSTPARLLDAEFAGTTVSTTQLDQLWNLSAPIALNASTLSGFIATGAPLPSGDGFEGGRFHGWFRVTLR